MNRIFGERNGDMLVETKDNIRMITDLDVELEAEVDKDTMDATKAEKDKFQQTGWCIVCHTPLDRRTEVDKCYCRKCSEKGYADKDNDVLKEWAEKDDSRSGMFARLASSTIALFMKEYKLHLNHLCSNPFDAQRQHAVKKDEQYIRSKDWTVLTMSYTDPNQVIRATRELVLKERKEKQEKYIRDKVAEYIKKYEAERGNHETD